MKLRDEQMLYVRSMGKILRITAVFMTDEDANAYMARNKDEAVIAVFGSMVLLANVHDRGIKVTKP